MAPLLSLLSSFHAYLFPKKSHPSQTDGPLLPIRAAYRHQRGHHNAYRSPRMVTSSNRAQCCSPDPAMEMSQQVVYASDPHPTQNSANVKPTHATSCSRCERLRIEVETLRMEVRRLRLEEGSASGSVTRERVRVRNETQRPYPAPLLQPAVEHIPKRSRRSLGRAWVNDWRRSVLPSASVDDEGEFGLSKLSSYDPFATDDELEVDLAVAYPIHTLMSPTFHYKRRRTVASPLYQEVRNSIEFQPYGSPTSSCSSSDSSRSPSESASQTDLSKSYITSATSNGSAIVALPIQNDKFKTPR